MCGVGSYYLAYGVLFVAMYLGACYATCPSDAATSTAGLGVDLLSRHVELVTHPTQLAQIAARDAAGALVAALALHAAVFALVCSVGRVVAACVLRCYSRHVARGAHAGRARVVDAGPQPAQADDDGSPPSRCGFEPAPDVVEVAPSTSPPPGALARVAAVARCAWYYVHVSLCRYA